MSVEETPSCYSCQFSATESGNLVCTKDAYAVDLPDAIPCTDFKELGQ